MKYHNSTIMDNILYYPNINVPKTDWAIRNLLYYDTIGAIVPNEYFYNPQENYEPFMYELIRNELVIPIDPMNSLERPGEVTEKIMEYLLSEEFQQGLYRDFSRRMNPTKVAGRSKIDVWEDRIHSEKFNPNLFQNYLHSGKFNIPSSKLHSEKFNYNLFRELERVGLAQRISGSWYAVEHKTASYMMGFLATVIGEKTERRLTTDKLMHRPIWTKEEKHNEVVYQNFKRGVILRDLIPYPQEIDIHRLRDFKERYYLELRRFRRKIEQLVLNQQFEVGSELLKITIEELIDNRDQLVDRMSQNRFGNIFFGCVCGLAGALIGFVTNSTVAGILTGAPGFANAVHAALQIEKPEELFDQTGMKYLALVDKRLMSFSERRIKR
ncbi:MAG: hypothetical protein LUH10_05310 [Tannerellaceae bacterium]|nr:hypothetical protein [Tannerellaceae bacterium]